VLEILGLSTAIEMETMFVLNEFAMKTVIYDLPG